MGNLLWSLNRIKPSTLNARPSFFAVPGFLSLDYFKLIKVIMYPFLGISKDNMDLFSPKYQNVGNIELAIAISTKH